MTATLHVRVQRRAFGHIYTRGPIWYVRYTIKGKRHDESTRSRSQRAAKKLLTQRQHEIESGTFAVVTITESRRSALRVLRDAHRLTQVELARLAGVTASHIAHLERRGYPAVWKRLIRLADALDVSADEILGRTQPTHVLDALHAEDRQLLDAMRDDAFTLFGERIGAQWRRIARTGWLGYLIGRRDQDLPRSDNRAPLIEEATAQHRVATHRAAQRGQPMPRSAARESRTTPAEVMEPLKPINGRIWRKEWYAGWESPRQAAHRQNLPQPAPRHLTAKQAAKKRKLLAQGVAQ